MDVLPWLICFAALTVSMSIIIYHTLAQSATVKLVAVFADYYMVIVSFTIVEAYITRPANSKYPMWPSLFPVAFIFAPLLLFPLGMLAWLVSFSLSFMFRKK